MKLMVKDIKSVKAWFNKNHRFITKQDVYFYTLESLSADAIRKMMKDEMDKYPSYEEREELIQRIYPKFFKKNPRQRNHFITQEDINNKMIIDVILFSIDYILKARSSNKKLYKKKTNSVKLPAKVVRKLYDKSNLVYWSLRIACHLQILQMASQHETTTGEVRRYRIHPKHKCDPTNNIIKELCGSETIADNIKQSKGKARNKRLKKMQVIFNEPVQLYSLYNLSWLKIDRDKAMAFWKGWRDERLKTLKTDGSYNQHKAEKVQMEYYSAVVGINRLGANDRFLTRDAYGRIHSNLTSFPRLLRPFLYFEGEPDPLYQLDLSNSQPLLLVFLFHDYFKEKHGKNFSTSDKLIAFCKTNGIEDLPRYIELVMNGNLYFELFRIQQSPSVPADRKLTREEKDALKKLLYTIFFGRKEDVERIADFVKKFEEAFPTVWAVNKHFKNPSHKTLAHKLQRTESDLFIDHVLRPLLVRDKLHHILSIHDCIVCGKSQIPVVKQQIKQAFSKAKFKLNHATLKIEGFGEDHEKDESVLLEIEM